MVHTYRVIAIRLYFLPVQTRVPLKFGHETLTSVTCARVALRLVDEHGSEAEGWGETPLSVQWAWPGSLPYEERHDAMKQFCIRLASAWMGVPPASHALEMGWRFNEEMLPAILEEFNGRQTRNQSGQSTRLATERPNPMPRLAALICNSAFDIALHDAFGKLVRRFVYHTYGAEFPALELSRFLEPAAGSSVSFHGRYPADYLDPHPPCQLRV
jgi:hypothetical protein